MWLRSGGRVESESCFVTCVVFEMASVGDGISISLCLEEGRLQKPFLPEEKQNSVV